MAFELTYLGMVRDCHLVIVPAGALGQLLDHRCPEVPAHDEVDDRVEDGVDEREQEEADASPGHQQRKKLMMNITGPMVFNRRDE